MWVAEIPQGPQQEGDGRGGENKKNQVEFKNRHGEAFPASQYAARWLQKLLRWEALSFSRDLAR